MLRLFLLSLLLLLAACQSAPSQPSTDPCARLTAEWGSPTDQPPPADLLLLGTLPAAPGDEPRYTVHYSAADGTVWIWYFYDADLHFCGPYVRQLTS